MRNRGVVWITHEDVAQLLDLPEGQWVHAIDASWVMMAIGVCVAGKDLPSVEPGTEAPTIPTGPYVDLRLRQKLRALLDRWELDRDGTAAEDVLQALEKTLTRELDPLVDMPEELRTD
jgi:hypothetical protein